MFENSLHKLNNLNLNFRSRNCMCYNIVLHSLNSKI